MIIPVCCEYTVYTLLIVLSDSAVVCMSVCEIERLINV